MRRIGDLSSEQQAHAFQDYLLTRDIDTQVDPSADAWSVWVLDEDHLKEARRELAEFEADPRAQRYVAASTQAEKRRQARLKEELDVKKRQINMRERWERPIYERIPVTILLIVASIGVTIVTRFGSIENAKEREITNQVYIQHVDFVSGNYNVLLSDVRSGEVWRLVTPIFLHMGWLHIAFNMYILFLFGGSIEEPKGPWRFLAFVLIMAVTSNVAQFFVSDPMFGGMSGVDFGLFGYLWMKSKFAPEEGFHMPGYVVMQFFVWTLLCMSGVVGNIANTAHMVGLASGMVIALTPVLYRAFAGR